MRIQIFVILILTVVSLSCDLYIWQTLKKRCRSKVPARIQLWTALALYLMVVVALMLPRNSGNDTTLLAVMWMLFGYLSIYIGKIAYIIFDLIASIPKLWKGKRIKWLSTAGTVAGVVVVAAMWWGALINRFNIQTRELEVEVPGLPTSLDGTRMVQISDLHLGTFGSDTSFLEKLIREIDSLHPDIVVFTGDIVNRRSEEMLPFVETMRSLTAPMGVYAILGNHDYGDYSYWSSPQAKRENMEILYDAYRRSGWRLLLNETTFVGRGNDSIALIGVENIGDKPFPTYGNLGKAYPTLNDTVPKILLTHNPAHWREEICDNSDINIALTLSGHTHAMQIELLGLSPAAFRYPTWGGYYIDPSHKHPLYVNIGDGTVGLPMRVGATPEITLIKLTKHIGPEHR